MVAALALFREAGAVVWVAAAQMAVAMVVGRGEAAVEAGAAAAGATEALKAAASADSPAAVGW